MMVNKEKIFIDEKGYECFMCGGKKCYVYEFENFEKNLAKIGEDMEKK